MEIALAQLVLGVLGVGGVGLTIYYAHKAWREARRAIDVQERQARPHILVKTIELTGLQTAQTIGVVPNACRFNIEVQNYGSTPGFVTAQTFSQFCMPSAPATAQYDPTTRMEYPVSVGEAYHPGSANALVSLDQPTRAKIRNGTWTFFVWGFIEYDDLNRSPHKTRFAYYLKYDPNRPDGGRLMPVENAPHLWEHT